MSSPAGDLAPAAQSPPGPQRLATHKVVSIGFVLQFLTGYNSFILGIALLQIYSALRLTAVESGVVLAATSAGMLVGGLALGRIADLLGRKQATIYDLGLIVLAVLGSAASTSATQLVIWQLLLGIGFGGGYPISAAYVADVAESETRGAWMTLVSSGWGVGVVASGLAGWVLLEALPASLGWRIMLLVGAAPAVIALIVLAAWHVPEAPAWVKARKLQPLPVSTLFTRENRTRTLGMLLPWFLVDIPVYGVGLLLPTLLKQLHFGGLNAVLVGNFVLAGFTLLGCLIPLLVIDHVGRRPLQIGGFVGMAVLLGWLAADGASIPWEWTLAVFAAIQVLTNAGPNTTAWIVAAELFPTRLRATSQGLATSFSRLGAVSGAFFLPIVDARAGLPVVFGLAAGVSLLGAILTWMWLPETARATLAQ